MMQTCPYCGNQAGYGYDQRFCNRCGNPLPVYGQAPAFYQPPPPPVNYYIPDGPAPRVAPAPPPSKESRAFWKWAIVIATVLIVVFIAVVAAYELSKPPPSPLVGKWNIEGSELNGSPTGITGTITFNADGSYRMYIRSPATDSAAGTWKDLGYGRMTIDDDSGFYELEGDQLRFGVNQDSEGDSWSFDCTKA
jgi:hypothetical protein